VVPATRAVRDVEEPVTLLAKFALALQIAHDVRVATGR
jgi:hypothetical protein